MDPISEAPDPEKHEPNTHSHTHSHLPSTSPPPPFPNLSPILSRLSLRQLHSRAQAPPPESDGFDNIPGPLPSSDPAELERIITSDPEVRRQMRLDDGDVGLPPDGGRQAWACVGSAFFVLFCVFGWSESGLVWLGLSCLFFSLSLSFQCNIVYSRD